MKHNNEILQYLHFGLGDVSRIHTDNPLPSPNDPQFEKRLIQIMSSPEYFYFAVKTLFTKPNDKNQPLISPSIHIATLNILWHYPFPMLIAHRGYSKSFLLAEYSMLRALLNQGSKITFIGAGFRQAKQLFNYAENLWNGSSILRDIVGDDGRNGPHKEADRWTIRLGDSLISAIPLGDGEKIRGERSNYLLVDEFKCIDGECLVETNLGLIAIKDCEELFDKIEVHCGNGIYIKPKYFVKTPPTDTYLIELTGGFKFKCSQNHPVFLKNGWLRLGKDLKKGDYVDIENTYKFPTKTYEKNGLKLNNKRAYEWGRLLCRSIKTLTKIRKRLINRVELSKLGLPVTKLNNLEIIPPPILQSPKHIIHSFLKGFLVPQLRYSNDKLVRVHFDRKNLKLYQKVKFILYKLNIYCVIHRFKSRFALVFNYDSAKEISKICGRFKDFKFTDKVIVRTRWGIVKKVTKLPDKEILYDFCLPKHHCFYANGVKQHNSVNLPVFEESVGAFSVVSQDPMERVNTLAMVDFLTQDKTISDKEAEELMKTHKWNQRVISGTAYYSFNHFYQYYQKYKAIIASAKNPKALDGVFPDGKLPEGLSPYDYAIIRVPVDASPKGFVDLKQIAQLKTTIHTSSFLHEFGACFTTDSNGFYSRKLIESCVVGNLENPIIINDEEIKFDAAIKGSLNKRYIYGIDPASESDNFAIVILEVYQTHRRVKYCWTTRKSFHEKRIKKGLTVEKSFYGFVIEKIIDLMKYFPCEGIAIDSGGGGITLREEFRACKPEAILEMKDPNDKKETDHEHGKHIIKMITFSDGTWVARANHGMKRDLEQKYLLFPKFNTVLAAATTPEEYENEDKLYDTLEDCMWEIEDLKDEVSIIEHSQTPSGRERWDLPKENETGTLRKDRYSALLMANALADEIQHQKPSVFDPSGLALGGDAIELIESKFSEDEPDYRGPAWFVNPGGTSDFGIVIKR